MIDAVYRVAGPDIVFEDFDGDLVVLNISTGKYFGFNSSAAAIWPAIMAGARPADLVGIGPDRNAIEAFVKRLIEVDLIVTADSDAAALTDDQSAAIAAQTDAPQVDVYDDLADLILADPIHDVDDEAGWPAVSAAE